ncbi:MAG TPA: hypothetical protein VLB76_01760 [Thermoanaerobaculia bacterium]|jgi:hypothetical protein|nr:hypothetical protein [Thermoanaerobaculia bacterium]
MRKLPAQIRHLGVAAGILLWLLFFFEGLMISSEPYRTQISSGLEKLSFSQAVLAIVIAFTSYIVTNAAILCCIAGALGASLGRFGYGGIVGGNMRIGYSAMGGLLRGFLVYLLWLSGVYVATASPFVGTDPDKYARLAGAFSLAAFAVGYQPQLVAKLLRLLNEKAEKEAEDHKHSSATNSTTEVSNPQPNAGGAA